MEPSGTAVIRAKAYKDVTNGTTKYVYLAASTKKGSTTPEINGETDYLLLGVAQ